MLDQPLPVEHAFGSGTSPRRFLPAILTGRVDAIESTPEVPTWRIERLAVSRGARTMS